MKKFLVIAVAGALAIAACGSDDDAGGSNEPAGTEAPVPATDAPVDSTAPSDTEPVTSDAAPDGTEPAADQLAPQPLAERTSVVFSLPAKITAASPYIAAGFLGEFDKENLDVEFRVVPSADSQQLLARGDTDVLLGSLGAGTLNRIASGLETKAVFPNQVPNEESKEGLWMRAEVAGDDGVLQAEELRGKTLYSVTGCGDALFKFFDYINAQNPDDEEITSTDLKCEAFSVPDTATALQNGAIEVALLLSPFWQQVDGDECCMFIAPFGEPPTGFLFFGPNMLNDQPEVGEALLRAISRTIRDNFQGDWSSNTELVDQLSAELEIPAESITGVPPTNFGTGIPAEELAWMPPFILERTQEDFFAKEGAFGIELLDFDEPLPYDQVYATQFLEALDQ